MAFIGNQFVWWHVTEGVARMVLDTSEVSDAIDAGRMPNMYGTIEGAIIHGGVLATAFKRRTEQTFDAARWLATDGRERVPMGEITITTITAQRE